MEGEENFWNSTLRGRLLEREWMVGASKKLSSRAAFLLPPVFFSPDLSSDARPFHPLQFSANGREVKTLEAGERSHTHTHNPFTTTTTTMVGVCAVET